jgi:hypothetical protein
MFGIVAKIVEKSAPYRARHGYWRRAMAPRGVALMIAAPIALMTAVGWALGLGVRDPAWLALTLLPMALAALNIGLDDVIKRGRRELRRGLELSATRIRELVRIVWLELRREEKICIDEMSDRLATRPSHDRAAERLPPPHPRLVAPTLAPRILPVPCARACHDRGIGRA